MDDATNEVLQQYANMSYAELIQLKNAIITENTALEKAEDFSAIQEVQSPEKDRYLNNLKSLAQLCYLIVDKRQYQLAALIQDEHYLIRIKNYLDSQNKRYDSITVNAINSRASGMVFTMTDHIRGLVYAMLTNQRKWKQIVPNLEAVDKIFCDYEINKILDADINLLYDKLLIIKCGNRSLLKQLQHLKENILILQSLADQQGSIDAFVTSNEPYIIVQLLSKKNSLYKLKMFGEALVWEYLRNVGIDGVKPDNHLRRFWGGDRMGGTNKVPASINEVIKTVNDLSRDTGLTTAEIDNIVWSYCSSGYGEICDSNPRCSVCVISNLCKKGENKYVL